MMVHFTQGFQKKTARLVAHNDQLRRKLKKQLRLFKQNPHYLGLRLRKLKGKRSEQFAVWVEGDLRALAIKEGDVYVFFDLVKHDQY